MSCGYVDVHAWFDRPGIYLSSISKFPTLRSAVDSTLRCRGGLLPTVSPIAPSIRRRCTQACVRVANVFVWSYGCHSHACVHTIYLCPSRSCTCRILYNVGPERGQTSDGYRWGLDHSMSEHDGSYYRYRAPLQ